MHMLGRLLIQVFYVVKIGAIYFWSILPIKEIFQSWVVSHHYHNNFSVHTV